MGERYEVKERQFVEVEWNLFRSTPHQEIFIDFEASDSVSHSQHLILVR